MSELCIGRQMLAADEGLYIAGPCAAQSREQLVDTATALKERNIMVLRAPDYKPRTTYGQFEGVGEAAHPWYIEIAQQHKMILAFEVRTPGHLCRIVDCVSASAPDANFLAWTGARTTEPKLVEEIARAAAGYEHVTLMQKNPMYEGVAEWEGLASRMRALPEHRRLLCYRGYKPGRYTPNPLGYRNVYYHEDAMLVAERTGMEVVLDVSHGPGKAELVGQALEDALAYKYRGLIIEAAPSHYVAEALTDRAQHVTVEVAEQLMRRHAEVRRLEVSGRGVARVMAAD